MTVVDVPSTSPWPEPGIGERLLDLVETARPAWHADAACRGAGPDPWFPSTRRPDASEWAEARAVCGRCVVRAECAEAGRLAKDGMWGGRTPVERESLRRRRYRQQREAEA